MAKADVAELQQLFDSMEAKQYKRPDMNENLRLLSCRGCARASRPGWTNDCEVTGDAKDAWTSLSVCLLVMLKMLGKNPPAGPLPRQTLPQRRWP